MTKRTRLRRGVAVAAVMAAAAAPGIALAAKPLKHSIYVGHAVKLMVSSTGKTMKVHSSGYCHKWSVNKVRLNRGNFSFTGSATNGSHATVHGRFVTSRRATGTVKVGSCAKKSFTARFIAPY